MSSAIEKHIGKLGMRAYDKVTGLEGVITCVCFDLYGCVQATINPGKKSDGSLIDPTWFDVARISIVDDTPVMDRPDFDRGYIAEGKKGAAEKSVPSQA